MVNDSAASRKSEVGIALSLALSMGTSTKDFLSVSNQVPPGGKAACVVAILGGGGGSQWVCVCGLVEEWEQSPLDLDETPYRGCRQRLRGGSCTRHGRSMTTKKRPLAGSFKVDVAFDLCPTST